MPSSSDWQTHLWPCVSCCRQIWSATFGDGCPGLVAYVPVWLALLVIVGRPAVRPLWRRRPVWLRSFASEEAELGAHRRGCGGGGGGDGGADAEDGDETGAPGSDRAGSAGGPDGVVDARPVRLGAGWASITVRPWQLMAASLFSLSAAGVVLGLVLALAVGLGDLYLTPVVPCLVSSILVAVDRPRSLPGSVLFVQASTLLVQAALLFGVPALLQGPRILLPWLAEMAVTALSLALLLAMPLRDPRLGDGGECDPIAVPFEPSSSKRRSPEDNLTLYQFMTVSWMAPVIRLGAARQLHDDDIWQLPFSFQHARLYRLFHDVRGSVTARVVQVNAPDLIINSALGILDSLLSMLPIILLKLLLASMEGPAASVRVAAVYAVFICVTNLVRTQAGVLSLWYTRRCYERSRGELITMIYEKTLRRKVFTFPGRPSSDDDDEEDGDSNSRANSASASASANTAPASTGKILNLMRNDVYEVAQRFWEFPSLFTKPLNFALSIFLLWRVLGGASLLGILVIVLAQVLNVFIVRVLVRWELARRAVTDIKLQVTTQFIESIRHLRWYDWQDKWLNSILASRQKELRYRVIANLIQKCIAVVNQMAATFFPVAAFYAFTVLEKRPLTVDVAFPALNLFNLLEQSLRELPDLITVLLNANVAMRRIEAFMAEPDKESSSDGAGSGDGDDGGDVLKQAPEGDLVDGIIRPPGRLYIGIEEASFAWPTAPTPILTRVNFVADGSGLTVVYGKVGTGKTALLMALLGEMDQHSGTRTVPQETTGYCAQTPWLQSMSVRENILFCLPYDEARYQRVVEACCLLPDFAEFEAGDLSNVGENGIGLSGGQKARVALARAVYSRARILLLDDPIAALDHHTAEAIMKRLFATSGLMRNRLVVFVTHRMDLVADYADQIYEVSDEHGVVTQVDASLVRRTAWGAPSADSPRPLLAAGDESDEGGSAEASSFTVTPPEPDGLEAADAEAAAAAADAAAANGAKNKFIEEEHRAHGGVMLSVYWRYVKAGGLHWWLAVILSFVVFRILKMSYLYFLKIWGEAYGHETLSSLALLSRGLLPPSAQTAFLALSDGYADHALPEAVHAASLNGTGWLDRDFGLPSPEVNVLPWLFWFAVLALLTLVVRTIGDILLIVITYAAGKQVFRQVMVRVSTAPFRFFDVTPVGRLMNRVTSDIGTIDGAIAQQIHRCAWFALNWLASIAVIAAATPTFLVMAMAMTVAFVLIFFRFLPASQSLRRLEMVSLSPLMSNFGTLVEGLTTVRAFRAQPHFQARIIHTTDAFQRMDHFYWSLQAWLLWRFNVLTALSTFALTMTALATGLSSGLVAFVLTAAANFVNSTQVLCRRYGELQMQFVSVERVTELLDLGQEPEGDVDPPAAWPTTSDDIVFDNVTVRYAPHLEPSLRGINMRIPAGATVAVTGRTGSGKSTLALALLGTVLPDGAGDEDGDDDAMPSLQGGSIYIGAMSVARVNKHALRQRISFVAQDPVLFPGSLRENLDPVGDFTDEECAVVLRRVLADTTGDFGLDSRVDGGGKNMSPGQRQLVGLGRAVLRRSPIVILDEATASIDKKTAYHIQEVLREELKHSTVITIAHRVEAVRDADFSVVLEHGRVVYAGPVQPE